MIRTSASKNPLAFRVPTVLEWRGDRDRTGNRQEHPNRRIFPRNKIKGTATATLSCASGPMQGQVTDLHECGAGIRASKPLALGSVVFVRFHQYKLMGFAQVRHCTNSGLFSYRIGLEFQASLMTEELGDWHIQRIAA